MGGLSPVKVKFLCSYGGKILPRHPDGKLRYYGGETRVVSVDRSISFSELLKKLGEMYGSPVCLRCQLPTEDLDALVSITSDEDLANILEEYDQSGSLSIKIRSFLSPPKSNSNGNKYSHSPSSASSSSTTDDSMSPKLPYSVPRSPRHFLAPSPKYVHHISKPSMMCPSYERSSGRTPHWAHHFGPGNNNGHVYPIHHGHH
ncbi:unnamed protein product [Cuscuta epithymum]|uniref:PB1 domain-containing protein n=1 Tax=Cuscuta epithymum TaxID=186058 RepID=A0AAV0E9J2_9ASTE|nr:unnamed protein product [Cuscuta epithymum]